MNSTQVGVAVAKAVFEVALSDTPGTVRERHRLSRERFRRFFATREASDVLMEAAGRLTTGAGSCRPWDTT